MSSNKLKEYKFLIIAFLILCILILASGCITFNRDTAYAAQTANTAIRTNADVQTVAPGETVHITVTLDSSRASAFKYLDLYFVPLTDDNEFDSETASELAVSNMSYTIASDDFIGNFYYNGWTRRGLWLSLAFSAGAEPQYVYGGEAFFKFEFDLTLSKNMSVKPIKLGFRSVRNNRVGYFDGVDYADNSRQIDLSNANIILNMQEKSVLRVNEYYFLKEYEHQDEYGEVFYYRCTYNELNLVHGVNDLSYNRVVLGQITAGTTVNQFLSNIDRSQRSIIRLFTEENQLIWDMGAPGAAVSDISDLDNAENLSVGTGWRIELGTVADAPWDKVYLSVLGDLDGDGRLTSNDVDCYYELMDGASGYNFAEIRLAGLILNEGFYSMTDIAILYSVINGRDNINNYFYPNLIPDINQY